MYVTAKSFFFIASNMNKIISTNFPPIKNLTTKFRIKYIRVGDSFRTYYGFNTMAKNHKRMSMNLSGRWKRKKRKIEEMKKEGKRKKDRKEERKSR